MVPDTHALRGDPDWLHLVSLLRNRKPLLIQDFLNRFDGGVVYGGKVPAREIEALLDSTMEMYLTLLSGEPLEPELQRLPVELGRRRARQGVRAEQLLQGVRTNSQVIWNALQEVSGEGDAGCLVRNTGVILSLVEWHVQEVQHAYLREDELLSRLTERRVQTAVAGLFEGPSLSAEDIAGVSRELGIRADATYDVLVQLERHSADCDLCARKLSGRIFVHQLPDSTIHFQDSSAGGFHPDKPMHGVGVPGTRGLARIREAVDAGLGVLRLVGAQPGLVVISDAWSTVAWKSLVNTIGEVLLPIDLTSVRSLRAEGRRRLIETVTVYFETGSIKDTAERLFCHRNTVIKRLDAFEELAGVDLSVPAQCALAVLALTALK